MSESDNANNTVNEQSTIGADSDTQESPSASTDEDLRQATGPDTQANAEDENGAESRSSEEKRNPKTEAFEGFQSDQQKVNKNIALTSQKIDLHTFTREELKAAKTFCVLSTKYIGPDTELERLFNIPDNRVCIISGGEGTGKIFFAKYLAARFMDQEIQPPISVHLYTGRSRSLLEIANDSSLPEDAVIIFRDVFKDVVISSNEPAIIQSTNVLKPKNLRFILTTTLPSDEIEIEPRLCLTSEGINPNEVYERYVEKYFHHSFVSMYRAALLERQEKVIQSLQVEAKKYGKLLSPLKIDKYIQGFLDKPDKLQENFQVTDVQEEAARTWFEHLEFNHRLYALLAKLFQGINFFALEEIYERSVQELRKSGMDSKHLFTDPREISTNRMHSSVGLRVVGNTLQFEDADYENEVNAQIKNYHRLLSSLIPWFIETIEQTPEENLHQILGNAIGRIGIYHVPKLDAWMERLALDNRGYVAITVAYILENVSERYDNYEYITDILREWAESKHPDLLWAAAVSISQIYDVISREAKIDNESMLAKKTIKELWSILRLLCENYKGINSEVLKRNREQLEQEIKKYVVEELIELDEIQQREVLSQIPLYVQYRLGLQQQMIQDQNSEIIIITICKIARIYPSDAVIYFEEWLTEPSEHPVWGIGRSAAIRVLEQSTREQSLFLEKRCFPLLKMLPAILRASLANKHMEGQALENILGLLVYGGELGEHNALASDRRLEQTRLALESPIFRTLETIIHWYEIFIGEHQPSAQQTKPEEQDFDEIDDDEYEALAPVLTELPTSTNFAKDVTSWESSVYRELLRVINFSTQEERMLLRNAFSQCWIDCRHLVIRRMAYSFIARCRVLEGMVIDLPTNKRYGIVLVDASLMAHQTREYIPQAFRLIQNLSALGPMRVHHLGQYDECLTTLSDKTHADKIITQDDLQLTRLRPSLLMPSLEFDPMVLNAPEKCYFILTLNLSPILDIEDFFSSFEQLPTEIVRNDAFAQALRRRQGEQKSSKVLPKWDWANKLVIVNHKAQQIPNSALPFISHLNGKLTDDLLSAVEDHLQARIITTLHSLQPDEWWTDLRGVYKIPSDIDEEGIIIAQLDEWVTRLNDIEDARHPKDVTLTIAWTLLALSQRERGIERVVRIIQRWLDADRTEDFGNVKSEERIKLYQQMGSACTRLLFNFYGAENVDAQPNKHDTLLRLLPPLLKLRRGYLEFAEIMTVVLRWAKQEIWSKRLLENEKGESELLTALKTVRHREDLIWLESFVERERAVIKFTSLFVHRNKSYEQFTQLVNHLQARRKRETQRQQSIQRKRSQIKELQAEPLPDGVTNEEERELLQLVQLPQADIDWIMKQIHRNQWKLLIRDKPEATALAEAQNAEMVLNSLSLLVQSKLDGRLPRLGDGEQYGLIIVDVAPSLDTRLHKQDREKLGRLAQAMAQALQRQNQETKSNKLTIILHRLGRQEIVYSSRGKTKLKLKELTPRIPMHHAPLIGAVLERYPADQIGFVLVITASEVLDFDDWFEDTFWKNKFWLHSIGEWRPSQVQSCFLSEDDDVLKPVVEEIIRKITLKEV